MQLRGEGLIWRRAGDELIALDLDSSQYLAVNETAAAVWEALAEGATRDELVALLCRRFDVGPESARIDVDGLVETLEGEGLLEREQATPRS